MNTISEQAIWNQARMQQSECSQFLSFYCVQSALFSALEFVLLSVHNSFEM